VVFFNGSVWAWIGVLPLATGLQPVGINSCGMKM
jgi:hypothetical protein